MKRFLLDSVHQLNKKSKHTDLFSESRQRYLLLLQPVALKQNYIRQHTRLASHIELHNQLTVYAVPEENKDPAKRDACHCTCQRMQDQNEVHMYDAYVCPRWTHRFYKFKDLS
jgi:hypothetical protein